MQEFKLNGESMDIVEDNIGKLKSIFPDIFTEGKVDFDKLQEILGNYIEKKDERYNFTWNGKSAALRLAQTPSTGTLRPCKEESKNWDTTENLYIEGDNLEVLKLLQKSYHNKIKMIYIDPPYNTGNDFVYKDDFKDNIDNYKKVTGQIDDDGNKISSNSESDGRYHTNWLNMMYPRLRLARNLLSDDGVIFISIDDNEAKNLKNICDEIFGETNFIAQLVWAAGRKNDSKYISISHEYMLCYVKNILWLKENNILWREKKNGLEDIYKEEQILRKEYVDDYEIMTLKLKEWYKSLPNGHPAKDHKHYCKIDNKGIYFPDNISWPGGGGPTYELINPVNNIAAKVPSRGWLTKKETMLEWVKEGKVDFGAPGSVPCLKSYLKDRELSVPYSVFYQDGRAASKRLMQLFGSKVFENPKDEDILSRILKFSSSCENNFIVLDFFSGSSTIANSVMLLNSEDNGNRKFICVQLPETVDEKTEAYKAGYKNICEIGKERIRRVGEKIKEEIESNNTQLKLNEEPKKIPDIGFKVFKLDTSNIKKWNGNAETIESEIQSSIFNYEVGRSELDVVYEIMLKCGLDLTYPIEEINVNGKILYSIGAGAMFVCMDNDITQDIADKIVEIKDEHDIVEPVTVFKDNGFTTDSNKTNIKETLRVAGIKDFITV